MLMVVTNRLLCKDDFLKRIKEICKGHPYGIILREKDLDEEAYDALATKCQQICGEAAVPLIINSHRKVAKQRNIPNIHLPIGMMREYANDLDGFEKIGVSVHSIEEAQEAQALGATYLMAGHIFETNCKKGLPPRGLSFLNEVCNSVTLPVFAIGGILEQNILDVLANGAKGACVMSQMMTSVEPANEIDNYYTIIGNTCQSILK